jgi:hypothetical protein
MDIKEAIRLLASGGGRMMCEVCTVDRVDEVLRTVDCTPLDDGAPYLGVNLQANQGSGYGIVAIPKPGSYVVVAVMSSTAAVVVATDEIARVELSSGGKHVRDLVGALGAIQDDVNALKQVFGQWVPVAQDGGSALKTQATSWSSTPLNSIEEEA